MTEYEIPKGSLWVKCPVCPDGALEESMEQDSLAYITDVECATCGRSFTISYNKEAVQ